MENLRQNAVLRGEECEDLSSVQIVLSVKDMFILLFKLQNALHSQLF